MTTKRREKKLTKKQEALLAAPQGAPQALMQVDLEALGAEQLRGLVQRLLPATLHYADPGNWTEHYIGGAEPSTRREYRTPGAHRGEANPNGWDAAQEALEAAASLLNPPAEGALDPRAQRAIKPRTAMQMILDRGDAAPGWARTMARDARLRRTLAAHRPGETHVYAPQDYTPLRPGQQAGPPWIRVRPPYHLTVEAAVQQHLVDALRTGRHFPVNAEVHAVPVDQALRALAEPDFWPDGQLVYEARILRAPDAQQAQAEMGLPWTP